MSTRLNRWILYAAISTFSYATAFSQAFQDRWNVGVKVIKDGTADVSIDERVSSASLSIPRTKALFITLYSGLDMKFYMDSANVQGSYDDHGDLQVIHEYRRIGENWIFTRKSKDSTVTDTLPHPGMDAFNIPAQAYQWLDNPFKPVEFIFEGEYRTLVPVEQDDRIVLSLEPLGLADIVEGYIKKEDLNTRDRCYLVTKKGTIELSK